MKFERDESADETANQRFKLLQRMPLLTVTSVKHILVKRVLVLLFGSTEHNSRSGQLLNRLTPPF